MLRISLQRFAQHESAILRVCFTARLRSALARVSRAASDFCRPETGVGVVARDIFETVNFPRGNVDDGDMTRGRRVAPFLFSVKRDASSIRRDRREDAVRDLFLNRAVESRYPTWSRSNAMCRSAQKTEAGYAANAKRRGMFLVMAIRVWRKR